jgi:predicted nucleic acid-binding protein
LAECAHVLRTQYRVEQADIIDALIGLVQKANVRIVDLRTDLAVELLVRARTLPGRPIPDALIVAASLQAGALPLATFDREQRRYGVATLDP